MEHQVGEERMPLERKQPRGLVPQGFCIDEARFRPRWEMGTEFVDSRDTGPEYVQHLPQLHRVRAARLEALFLKLPPPFHGVEADLPAVPKPDERSPLQAVEARPDRPV